MSKIHETIRRFIFQYYGAYMKISIKIQHNRTQAARFSNKERKYPFQKQAVNIKEQSRPTRDKYP